MRKTAAAALALMAIALTGCQERTRPPEAPAAPTAADGTPPSPEIIGNFRIDGYRDANVVVTGDVVTITRINASGPQGVRIRRIGAATTPAAATLSLTAEDVRFAVMRGGERQYPEAERPYRVAIGPNALDDVVLFSRTTPSFTIQITNVSDCGTTTEAACLAPPPTQ